MFSKVYSLYTLGTEKTGIDFNSVLKKLQ